ncbi:unnamed protein product [Spirodela intermedia]|uniref:BPL/LPL catalytic domain-containing protein n=1 Tax=Spirodela intermedia TaxID=51605 RepID=A0ABN7EDP5_SPIIN|nr:unnamed protein product [Spirodela intermedia]
MEGPRDGPPPGSGCLLVLCGKSRVEKDQARSLAAKGSLKLKHDGNEIAITLRAAEGEESSLASPEETFRTQMYMGALSTSRFGGFLLWSPCLPSTQDVVSQNFGELPIGAVCVADFQSRGRGRTKNVWESPAGCLMFSFTVEMEDGRVVPLLQYVISLAVSEATKEICRAKGLPPLDVKIKWPNDLYLNGLKIGGVLCTSTYKSKKFSVSAADHIFECSFKRNNFCLTPTTERRNPRIFFNNFDHLFEKFLNEGFQALEELYYRTWLHRQDPGLTPSGYLLAADDADNLYDLDFFQGLVRRKLG